MRNNIVPVNVIALLEEPVNQHPVIVLHDPEKNRVLPIWIGYPESRAIAMALGNVETERPLTHTLLLNTIEDMQGRVSRVVIDKLEQQTYFATIYVTKKEELVMIDARPSDAIALALLAQAPLLVTQEIMEAGAQENPFKQELPRRKKRLSKKEVIDLKILLSQARKREQPND